MHAEMFDDKLSLIDDSSAGGTTTVGEGGRVFNVVSGSITDGVHTAAADEELQGEIQRPCQRRSIGMC